VGIDIGKPIFHVLGLDMHGAVGWLGTATGDFTIVAIGEPDTAG
jgi:hypothetical protein